MKNINRQQTNNKSGVYLIENIKNGKKYIGSTTNLYYRLKFHLTKLRKNNHHNIYLQRSFNKYKEVNFKASIIEFCDKKIMRSKEKYWIDFYKSEYNMRDPIDYSITNDIKKRISKTLKEKYESGELKAFNHPNSMIPIVVYDNIYNLIGNYESLNEASRKIKDFNKNSLKLLIKRKIPFYKHYIIIPYFEKNKKLYVINYFKKMKHISSSIINSDSNEIINTSYSDYLKIKSKLREKPFSIISFKDKRYCYLGINMPSIK